MYLFPTRSSDEDSQLKLFELINWNLGLERWLLVTFEIVNLALECCLEVLEGAR